MILVILGSWQVFVTNREAAIAPRRVPVTVDMDLEVVIDTAVVLDPKVVFMVVSLILATRPTLELSIMGL